MKYYLVSEEQLENLRTASIEFGMAPVLKTIEVLQKIEADCRKVFVTDNIIKADLLALDMNEKMKKSGGVL